MFFYVNLHLIVQNKNLMLYNYFSTIIKFYNKNYLYIFFTLFILITVIFFSKEIGLGVEKNFIFYQKFGIFRSSIFSTFIFITLLSLVILVTFKMFLMQKHDQISNQNIFRKSFNIYVFLTFIFLIQQLIM